MLGPMGTSFPPDPAPFRTLAWFRGRDLRVEDQPTLQAALGGQELIPLWVEAPRTSPPTFRAAFQEEALRALDAALRARGSGLCQDQGDPEEVLLRWVARWKVARVEALRRVEPRWRERDARLATRLAALGCTLTLHEGDTLVPPGSLRTGSGGPFSVFTPFARAFHQRCHVPLPQAAAGRLPPLPPGLAPRVWEPAGPGSAVRLEAFLATRLEGYAEGRNQLGREGISRLSADLRAGTLSIRTLWHAVQDRLGEGFDGDVRTYLNELLWREFAHHTLVERPELLQQPFRPAWKDFPYRTDGEALQAWKEGRTGFPVVDAAARELLATGFVHNRARMVAASFLTKHLLVDWRLGEAHYRQHLVDGCEAANSLGWQWSAGCGVDAQPWFRIFNPEAQAQRFDPQDFYVRRWVPEGVATPIVDHALARQRFLATAKAFLG